ncbi:MAG: hypothetical protein ICV64_08295 [Thermoleophilia bacterium]|nr:hypothetical protein [Thermoleophilia bacterium]
MQRGGILLLLAGALLAGGCAGDDDGPDEAAPPFITTPSEIRTAVWERAYSECASNDLEILAGKYNTRQERGPVATAVGAGWAKSFGGGEDAAREGRAGCLAGFKSE